MADERPDATPFYLVKLFDGRPAVEEWAPELYQRLYDGEIVSWGRLPLSEKDLFTKLGPRHPIHTTFWLTHTIDWTTIGPNGTNRAIGGDYQDIRFDKRQCDRFYEQMIVKLNYIPWRQVIARQCFAEDEI